MILTANFKRRSTIREKSISCERHNDNFVIDGALQTKPCSLRVLVCCSPEISSLCRMFVCVYTPGMVSLNFVWWEPSTGRHKTKIVLGVKTDLKMQIILWGILWVRHTCCINPTRSCIMKSYRKEKERIKIRILLVFHLERSQLILRLVVCVSVFPLTISKSLLIRNRMRIRGDRGKFSW